MQSSPAISLAKPSAGRSAPLQLKRLLLTRTRLATIRGKSDLAQWRARPQEPWSKGYASTGAATPSKGVGTLETL